MLGAEPITIKCGRHSCKFNYSGWCRPPKDKIEVNHKGCVTYTPTKESMLKYSKIKPN